MEDRGLDAYSWVTLVIFLLSIVPVIRPFKIPFFRQTHIRLNLATSPPLGVLILLIIRAIPITTVRDGCIGSMGIQPYAILILFYSLAYICISLDLTGLFQYLAFWVSRKAGNRGILAFTLFFCLTSLMSGLTSNDVVILTGTVFLSYFTRVSGINPTAFLVSEFTTANIASMALYIGNPTNVIVSEAYDISFIEYSAWMLLPTVVTLLLAYCVLRVMFNNPVYLPRQIVAPDASPNSVLLDPKGAVFGTVLLACCLATLVGTSFAGVSVWMVTLPFAVVTLVRDFLYDLGSIKWMHSNNGLSTVTGSIDIDIDISTSSTVNNGTIDSIDRTRRSSRGSLSNRSIGLQSLPATRAETAPRETVGLHRSFQRRLGQRIKRLGYRWPTVFAVIQRMPWAILPFSLGMFVLVEGLSLVGWVGVLAKGLVVFTLNYVTAVYGVTFVSIVACQLLNNLPMTILLTRIIQHPNFSSRVTSPVIMQGVLLGLIVGSNLGACLTLVGSLAGIMFDHILKSKNIHVLGYRNFLGWNLILLPVLALGASSVIIGELWFIYQRS
ncbi:hypothetical protein J3Q64DRAFT_1844768 [Phycomyces blakesleeanus]|uniref:Citrate transporter-like domain-containing protein n=2 Tax=Phycomyces blakesleeanus TaxID=4837 RepID=A0ABR3BF29_PHYBL